MYNSIKIIAAETATDSYQNLGPGAYDYPNEFDLKKNNKQKSKDTSFGVSKRNMIGDANTMAPGPGHYSKHANEMNDWHKKTFNYRYLKQFHQPSGSHGASLTKDMSAIPPRAKSDLQTIQY